MLAVDPAGHARSCSYGLTLQSSDVASVDDIGRQATQQAPQLPFGAQPLPGRLVKGDDVDLGALDAVAEVTVVGEAEDDVTEILGGQPVDQIDQAVLEATHVQAVDDVGDERGHGNHWIMKRDLRQP